MQIGCAFRTFPRISFAHSGEAIFTWRTALRPKYRTTRFIQKIRVTRPITQWAQSRRPFHSDMISCGSRRSKRKTDGGEVNVRIVAHIHTYMSSPFRGLRRFTLSIRAPAIVALCFTSKKVATLAGHSASDRAHLPLKARHS